MGLSAGFSWCRARAEGVAALAVLLLLASLGGCDRTTPTEHLSRAEHQFSAADYRTAIIELKNALQKDPELGEARLLLGQSYEAMGEYENAIREFERALNLGVESDVLRLGLLKSKVRVGRYQEVIGELAGEQDLEASLQVVLADAYLSAGSTDLARPLYEQTLPDPQSYLGLGLIAWMEGDDRTASDHLERAAELGPADRDIWMRKGEFELSRRSFEAAVLSFRQAQSLPAGELPARIGLTRAYLAQGNPEAARTEIDRVLSLAHGFPLAHYLDALVRYQLDDVNGAEAALREVQRTLPEHAPSLYLMGVVKYRQGQPAQAVDSLQRYLAIEHHNESAAKLLASIYFRQQNFAGAASTLEPYLAGSSDAQLFAMAGMASLRTGKLDRATELLERAVALAPDAAIFRNQLALSLLSIGQEDRARTELESALSVDEGQFQSDYLLALLGMKRGDYTGAMVAIDRMVAKEPENPVGYNIRGAVLTAQNRLDEAAADFEKALAVAPRYFPAVVNLARLDQQSGSTDRAVERYESYLALQPDDIRARFALVDLSMRAGEPEAAERQLLDIVREDPQSLRARIGLARLYLLQNKIVDADEQASAAKALDATLPDVALLDAEIALRKGDLDGARRAAEVLRVAVSAGQPSVELLLQAARVQRRTGLATQARQSLDRAWKQSGEGELPVLYEQIRLEVQEQNAAAARQRLELARARAGSDPAFQLLEADVLRVEGRHDDAAARYAALAESGDREALGRLVAELSAQGRYADALRRIDSWLSRRPEDSGIMVLKADLLLRTGDPDSAITVYEALSGAGNPAVLNNLAWLYMERGDDRALATAEQAWKLAPDNGDVADTLGWILVRAGEPERAIAHIERSVERNPENPTIRYHLGVAYLEAGRTVEGKQALETALSLGELAESEDAKRRLSALGES